MGKLTPIFCEPVCPGDTFKMSAELYTRFQALLSPAMAHIDSYIHFFYVPNRLIYDGWRPFITGGTNGATEEVYPRLSVLVQNGYLDKQYRDLNHIGKIKMYNDLLGIGSNIDYLGFPVSPYWDNLLSGNDGDPKVTKMGLVYYQYDLLPPLSLYRIWCDYFRDENLEPIYDIDGNEVDEFVPIKSGIYDFSDYVKIKSVEGGFSYPLKYELEGKNMITEALSMHYRAWEKDYFTSALPWAQRGGEVIIPGTNTGNIDVSDIKIGLGDNGHLEQFDKFPGSFGDYEQGGGVNVSTSGSITQGNVTISKNVFGNKLADQNNKIIDSLGGSLIVDGDSFASKIAERLALVQNDVAQLQDLSTAEGTINNLRRANALQRYLEAMARGGSRYIEQIKQIFGVTSSDARLQRSEYLGGGKAPVVISEVLQQSGDSISPSGDEQVLGSYAGRAVSGSRSRYFKRFFEEHGWVIGILSFKPRISYAGQGMPRKFTKFDRFDYLNPYFAHLGEQEIKTSEIYYDAEMGTPDSTPVNATFGYAPRYAEYKDFPSRVSGNMRGNLLYWNLARKFEKAPNLNADFIHVTPQDADRIFSVDFNLKNVVKNLKVTAGDEDLEYIVEMPNDRLVCQLNFDIKMKRCLPRNSVPRL